MRRAPPVDCKEDFRSAMRTVWRRASVVYQIIDYYLVRGLYSFLRCIGKCLNLAERREWIEEFIKDLFML